MKLKTLFTYEYQNGNKVEVTNKGVTLWDKEAGRWVIDHTDEDSTIRLSLDQGPWFFEVPSLYKEMPEKHKLNPYSKVRKKNKKRNPPPHRGKRKMSREFWIYDNGEEPCLAFQDEENAKEIRRQDKIFYCRQVNPALDAAIEGLVTSIETAVKYLNDCGYKDVDESESEYQMLKIFKNELASYKAALEGK